MKYISKQQCRAARGLLGWTQAELAKKTGLSKTSVNNYERGLCNTKSKTILLLKQIFEQSNIVFLDFDGVQKRQDHDLIILETNAYDQLIDDIITNTPPGSEPVLINESFEFQKTQEFSNGLSRLNERKIVFNLYNVDYANPKGLATYCYGNKTAYHYNDHHLIIIIDSYRAYQAERERNKRLITAEAK